MIILLQVRKCPWATAVRQTLANVEQDDVVIQVPYDRTLRHEVIELTGQNDPPRFPRSHRQFLRSETRPMPERYAKVDPSTLQERERKGGGAASRDLGGALGAENITARVWRFGPGHEMAYHRHRVQEEFYQLVSGGPQEVLIEGDAVVVNDGEWLRLPKDTNRKIQNHTDREAIWLTIGAPPGEGITDGMRIDIETGQEIPR